LQAFRSFIDADARFVSSQVVRGVDAIAEAWAVFFTDPGPTIKWRPMVIEVLENNTLALSRGPYRVVSQHGRKLGDVQFGLARERRRPVARCIGCRQPCRQCSGR
jgi:hypothetical protein